MIGEILRKGALYTISQKDFVYVYLGFKTRLLKSFDGSYIESMSHYWFYCLDLQKVVWNDRRSEIEPL